MRRIISKNPFTSKINTQIDYIQIEELNKKLERAEQGYQIHKKRSMKERGDMIKQLGSVISKKKNNIAELITMEMGKPISQSLMEVEKTMSFCKHYSRHFSDVLPTQIKSDAKLKTLIKYLPMGTIYFIVPFNFPFFLTFKGGLPNLLLGNVCLTRFADSCPLLGSYTEEIMNQAGYDSGEFQNVYTAPDQLERILERDSVAGVSFTGSSKTGALIAEKAGKHLKKSVMQLGGNDPFVVLFDANLGQAIQDAYIGRTRNSGQICFSPKRFIIVKEHYDKFKEKLIEKLQNAKYGDPMDSQVELGPLAREDLYNNLEQQMSRLPSSWKISWKRQNIQKPFYPITVVDATEQVFDEELFGPIFTLFRAQDEKHAIHLANQGSYGLGASVYGISRGEAVVDQIRSGMSFVNTFTKSDYCFPTGGVGKSGYGRECGVDGARSFANIRVHYVN